MTTAPAKLETVQAEAPRLADPQAVRVRPFLSPVVFSGLVRTAEGALLTSVGFLVAALYLPSGELDDGWRYGIALLGTPLFAVGLFQLLGLYRISALTNPHRQLLRVALGWTTALAALLIVMFLSKLGGEFSRVWFLAWGITGLATSIAVRFVVSRAVRKALADGRLQRRAVIYGIGDEARRMLAELDADASSDVRICGIFDDRGDDRTSGTIAGYPKLGDSEAVVAFALSTRVDVIILTLPLASEARLAALTHRLAVLPVEVKLAASASMLKLHPRAYSYIGSVAILDVCDKPIDGWSKVWKSVLDRTVAGIAILALAPVMALVWLAVRLESKGPALFRQRRLGFNNEIIEVWKFRSMHVDRCDQSARRLVTRDDPRVTRVGRFIRRTSLDELPQLFNVLGGSLSLVGPRPHAIEAKAAERLYHEAVEGYFARHKVKPGITGWAQIHGWRGETDTEEKIRRRVEHDLW
jgi:Undecaprenyl-phosphate glucose phosphotransferase